MAEKNKFLSTVVLGMILIGGLSGRVACETVQEEVIPALVHDGLAGALVGNSTRVTAIHNAARHNDRVHRGEPSGIVDDLAVLEILSSTATQEEKATRLRKLAGKINDPVARERLLDLAERSSEYQLEDLRWKNKVNKVTGLVNRTWRTTAEVAAGQPSAIAEAGTDLFFSATGRNEPTVAEKKIAYLSSLREIRGEASPEEIEQAREMVKQIEKRKSDNLLRDWKAGVKKAKKVKDWWQADRLCRLGAELWPESATWFQEQQVQIEEQASLVETETREMSEPIGNDPMDQVGYDLIRKKLVQDTEESRMISDRESRQQIKAAQSERRSKTLNYLLFGETSRGMEFERATKTLVAHGADAPMQWGIFQGLSTAIRGVTLFFGNELGVRNAIETYAYHHRTNPESLTQKDYQEWADLCAKIHDYDGALRVLVEAGIEDPRREKRYRNGWGDTIVSRCEAMPPCKERMKALQFVIHELHDTPAVKAATRLLQEAPLTDAELIPVKRSEFMEHREELTQAGLSFRPEWWDGKKSNGEIDDEGVYWDTGGVLWFRTGSSNEWRKVEQEKDKLIGLNAAFAGIEESILAKRLEEQRRSGRRLPVEIEGELGASTYVAPKLIQYDINDDREGLFR